MINFEKEGFVSIWVGLQPRPNNTDVLKKLCGVEYCDVDFQEHIKSADGEESPIDLLLRRLSYANSYIKNAMKAAQDKGITAARWAIAQADFAYDPMKVQKKIAPDPVIIGAFKWSRD